MMRSRSIATAFATGHMQGVQSVFFADPSTCLYRQPQASWRTCVPCTRCLQGLQTVVVADQEPTSQAAQEAAKYNELWLSYPDDNPPRTYLAGTCQL